MFITVTSVDRRNSSKDIPTYVNIDTICFVDTYETDVLKTRIVVFYGEVLVKETPEEVLQKIKEAQNVHRTD